MEIKVPTSMYEVPLYQMLEYTELSEEIPENLKQLHAVSIFCQISMDEVRQMPLSILNKAVTIISKWANEKPKFYQTFEFKGKKYGFIPNLDTLPMGEYVDLDNYLKENRDMYKVMSVLYREISIIGQGKRYDIETYKGEINEDFKELPSEICFGARVFFWSLGIDLLSYIQKSLRAVRKGQRKKSALPKNGDGWESFNFSLTEILQDLKQSVERPCISVSSGRLTKATLVNLNNQNLKKQSNEQ